MKRFFVQAPPDLQKRLRILAVTHDSTAEKYGGILLERIVGQVEAEMAARKSPPPKKR